MTRRRQISVIGAAVADDVAHDLAFSLGRAAVDAGWRIVCGGLSGVMEAACHGARSSAHATGADTIGILPMTDPTAANPYVDIVVPTGLGHARNVLVVASGDAVVAVGGRSGTLSEIAFAWTLGKPLVALTPAGGWGAAVAGTTLDERHATPVVGVTSAEEAIDALKGLLTTQ